MSIDPRIKTPTHMYEDPQIQSGRTAYPETLALQFRRVSVPLSTISDHGRDALTSVFSRLTENRSHRSGSLREEISRVAPFANDYDDAEERDDA